MKCSTPRCNKKAPKGNSLCYSCRIKQYKQRHPVKYAFQVLKNNAKRRGKAFELTFEQFEQFCYETDVLHGRGRTSNSYHIDRIDNDKGYTIDNIQVLTNAQNITKENKRRKKVEYNWQHRFGFMLEVTYHNAPLEDIPF